MKFGAVLRCKIKMVLRSVWKFVYIVGLILCTLAISGICTPCAESEIMAMYCSQNVTGRNQIPCLFNLTYTTFCTEDSIPETNIYPPGFKNVSECSLISRPIGTVMICRESRRAADCNISCNPGMLLQNGANVSLHIVCNNLTSYKWFHTNGPPLKDSDFPVCTDGVCPRKLSVLLRVEDKKKDCLNSTTFPFNSDNCNITVRKSCESSNVPTVTFNLSVELGTPCTKQQLTEFIKSKGGRSSPMNLIFGYYCIEKAIRNILTLTTVRPMHSFKVKRKRDNPKENISTPYNVSTVTAIKVYCRPGTIEYDGICSPCQPGSKFKDGECELCDIGFYQNKFGQQECKMCPRRMTSNRGARSINDCRDIPPDCTAYCSARYTPIITAVISGGAGLAGSVLSAIITTCICCKCERCKEGRTREQNDDGQDSPREDFPLRSRKRGNYVPIEDGKKRSKKKKKRR